MKIFDESVRVASFYIFTFALSLSLSLSHTHTHTHTHISARNWIFQKLSTQFSPFFQY